MRWQLGRNADRFDGCFRTIPDRLEGSAAHGTDYLLSFRYLDGNDGVARIDGPLEAARTDDGHDVSHLCQAKQCSHARQQVPAKSRRWRENAVIVGGERDDLRREDCGQGAGFFFLGNQQHALYALELRGFGSCGTVGCGEHHHICTSGFDLYGAVQAAGRTLLDVLSVVFGNDEYSGHAERPRSRSAVMSSATSLTTIPLPRGAGVSWRSVRSLTAVSAPRLSIGSVSIGFFFAFMMSGSFT